MITVFTPAYNRANLLDRLYASLVNQQCKDFEWLIVDDGSSDNTKDVVNSFIQDNKIDIRYIYQDNKGKHVAFNTGVKNANGNLFFCVDSDDFLSDNCISDIVECSECVSNDNIAGIIAKKTDTNGNLLSGDFPNNINTTTLFDLSSVYGCYGEKSLVYKTEILVNNLYPQIENEKFIGECVVYDKIDQSYRMFLLDKVLTICEYQQDGLTSNVFNIMISNPTGYKIYHSQRIDMSYGFKQRLGHILRYNAFDILCKDNQYNYNGKYCLSIWLFKPFGYLISKYYKMKKRLK